VVNAYNALRENNIDSAPIWDHVEGSFIGIFSTSDFINVLLKLTKSVTNLNNVVPFVQQLKINNLSLDKEERGTIPPQFLDIEPTGNLYEAISNLVKYNIHSIPVINDHTLLYILTPRRILSYLIQTLPPISFFQQRIDSIGIRSLISNQFKNVAYPDTTLNNCLQIRIKSYRNLIPIIDKNTNEFFDVIVNGLGTSAKPDDSISFEEIAIKVYKDISRPICEIMSIERINLDESQFICYSHDDFKKVIQKMIDFKLKSIVCIENVDSRRYIGIISIFDILRVLLNTNDEE